MAVREIRLFGDPVLKTACEPIVDFGPKASALVADLLDTTKLPGRAGVAANQMGVSLRAFAYNVHGEIGYILNPRIDEVWGEKHLVGEGCLSVPDLWHKTPRFENARVIGQNLRGEEIFIEGSGLLAQALQHECDHLDGYLYLDRLDADERKSAMKALRATDWFMKS